MKKQKILKERMNISTDRGPVWTGIRPAVFKNRKKDAKLQRREGKETSRAYPD